MKSSTGHWVVGDDFFDREGELKVLESRVRDGNHLVMTGQRRMGKTSILRELGHRLERKGWVFLFADVEADRSEEDVITSLAKACHPITPITSRLMRGMRRRLWTLAGKVDQVSAHQFAVRFRAGLDSGNWRRHGEDLIAHCAGHDQPVLIVIDEVPIFLVRLLNQENGARRVDEFLSWLRAVFQKGDHRLPTLILSGSIRGAELLRRPSAEGLLPRKDRHGAHGRIQRGLSRQPVTPRQRRLRWPAGPSPSARCEAVGPESLTAEDAARLWDNIALTEQEDHEISALNLVLAQEVTRVAMLGDGRGSLGERRIAVRLKNHDKPALPPQPARRAVARVAAAISASRLSAP